MDLPTLKHHRGVTKASLTKTVNFLKTLDKPTVSISLLKNKRILTEQQYKRFDELQQDIEEHTKDDDAETLVQVAERDEVEAKFLDILSQIDDIIDERTPKGTPSSHVCSTSTTVAVKLPPIDLPKFTGKYDEWSSFMDLFESTIDGNTTLSDVQKLQYLKSLVTEEAATIIRNLPTTALNYKEAWTLLKNRYNNQREIVYFQVRRLFNIPSVKMCNASSIQQLLDLTNECVRALTVLKQPTDKWDTLLVYMTVDKFDFETKKQWALQLEGSDLPTYTDLSTFLEQHIRGLNACNSIVKSTNDKKITISHHSSSNSATVCVICKTGHPLFKCAKFLEVTVNERINIVKRHNLCFNCLKPNHKTVDCKGSMKCKTCNRQHHSMLHYNRSEQHQSNPAKSSQDGPASKSSHHMSGEDTDVLLTTAVVHVRSHTGEWLNLRILLDGGSQGTLIREECVQALGLKREWDKTLITGIGAAVAGHSRGKVACRLHSKVYNEHIDITALVMRSVTKPLPDFPCKSEWDHLEGVKLADPNFSRQGPIDIVLGVEYTMATLLNGKINGDGSKPYAINTIFGWAVGGRIAVGGINAVSINHAHCETESIVKRFWEIEEVPKPKFYTEEEKICEEHFLQTHTRDLTGRFCVQLPVNKNISKLGYSREIAINRLKQVERRLLRQPEYRQEYNKFIREAIELGHMQCIPRGEVREILGKTNYLCHHFVLKPDSTTTKFRVVYDGSAKTSSGVSLNDCLRVGATIQNDIFTLLIKFRINKVAIKADIAKMFRQFSVTDEHADLQRIVWRDDPSEEIHDYKLVTITYGTASAPFQATRCLQQLADENKASFPLATEKLTDEIYVDDLIGSCESTEQAIQVVKDLMEITTSAGLSFRKWSSNDHELLQTLPEDIRETTVTSFDKESNIKALGVQWNSLTDNFCFGKIDLTCKKKLTKRVVLSQLAKVFDPLGFISPVTINAKIFIQGLWMDNLQWDDLLSPSLCEMWNSYGLQMINIETIEIRRWLKCEGAKTLQLHGFCDSSERALGACIYLRCECDDGSFSSYLIAAKSKVAPLQNQTLPRLELCAAVLLALLLMSVKRALNIDCEVFAWTDSMIVLQWLASYPGRWMTFVANRVAAIQDSIPFERWNHVRSEDNPADIVSRGTSANELRNSSMWWNGPAWLATADIPPRVVVTTQQNKHLEERKKPIITMAHVNISESYIDRFSSYNRMISVFTYILKFIDSGRKQSRTDEHVVRMKERVLTTIVKIVQSAAFPREIELVKRGEALPSSNKLLSLNPFLDSDGVLRVGGRLSRADVPVNSKHPIIIPHDSTFTKLLIENAHRNHLHGGLKLVWSYLQTKYWIINGRNTIRFALRKCVICRRHKAEKMSQLMGSLPTSRVTAGRPFLNTGCDYAGPITLKAMKDGRGKKLYKGYFCIFVCMATKAVHLEPVSDMTTESFIETLRRFVSRRGIPAVMHSDCGTNFAGADKELRRLVNNANHNQQIEDDLAQQGIEWRFNPPSSPHHGGLWEAGVKSVKYHLRRVIGTRNITFEEFATILCQVEACLNSRPLCALSADPDDLDVLTPGHFLVGHPLTALPQQDLVDVNVNRLSRWEYTQQCFQHFWKRWRVEYLSTLQQRFKWKCKRENICIGDLVIIHDENYPPMKWRMGRVMQLHAGADGCVRVVTVKTASGELKRPIVKLTPILFNTEQ